MSPPTDRNLIRAAKLVQRRLAQIAAEEERLDRFLGELSGVPVSSRRRRTGRSATKAQQPERPELEPPTKPAPRPPKRRRRKRSAQPS